MVSAMIISKDVFSQGSRGAFHRLTHTKIDPRRYVLRGAPAQFMVLGGDRCPCALTGGVGRLILPPTTGLHQAAAGLLVAAMVGLGMAFAGAYSGKSPKNVA